MVSPVGAKILQREAWTSTTGFTIRIAMPIIGVSSISPIPLPFATDTERILPAWLELGRRVVLEYFQLYIAYGAPIEETNLLWG